MNPPTLSVIVPTIGRPTLARTLDSIRAQDWIPGDQVVIVGDGIQATPVEVYKTDPFPSPSVRVFLDGPSRDWGHTPSNAALPLCVGDYLLRMDDDDIYLPGAFATIRAALLENPGRPHLFRMHRGSPQSYPGGDLWSDREVRCGNLSTQMICVPNDPRRLGRYRAGTYEGDFYFLADTLEKYPPGSLVWREEFIAHWRP